MTEVKLEHPDGQLTLPVRPTVEGPPGLEIGNLRYRGYPIDQLAERSTFLEVCYLLIYGELPTAEQLEAFTQRLSRHTLLHEDFRRFFQAFPRDAHPMPVLSS